MNTTSSLYLPFRNMSPTEADDIPAIQNETYQMPSETNTASDRNAIVILFITTIMPVIGIIGNMLSFIVLMQKKIRKTSVTAYLASISIMDSIALIVMVFEFFYGHIFAFRILISSFLCKTRHVLKNTALISSAWLLVGVTIERFIAVCFPFKATSFLKVAIARRISAGIVITVFLTNCYGYWIRCRSDEPELYVIYLRYITLFGSIFYPFLPCIIISILNSMILRQLFIHSQNRITLRQSTGTKNKMHDAKITKMILIATFAYILCTTPYAFFNTMKHFRVFDLPKPVNVFVQTWIQFLLTLNHGGNFLIYVFSGTRFRKELWRLCNCCCRRST